MVKTAIFSTTMLSVEETMISGIANNRRNHEYLEKKPHIYHEHSDMFVLMMLRMFGNIVFLQYLFTAISFSFETKKRGLSLTSCYYLEKCIFVQ